MNQWRTSSSVKPLGVGIAAGLFAIAFAAIFALLSVGGPTAVGSSDTHNLNRLIDVAGFTLYQAGLSTILAAIIALPVARTCWRRASTWRANHLISLSFLSIVMPTTVAVTGLLGVWGQNGAVSTLLRSIGLEGLPPIYGLGAVLLAHVFFNAPLMLRVFMSALAGVPAAHWRLAAQWGLSSRRRFVVIEWPALKRVLPGVAGLVFLLCFTSFSLVLMLGGGPAVTTLEVSIYTALRFEFNLPLAALLSLAQLVICACVVTFLARFQDGGLAAPTVATHPVIAQPGDSGQFTKMSDGLMLAGFILLSVAPLIMLGINGISANLLDVVQWPAFHRAVATSVMVAVISASLATLIAVVLAATRIRLHRHGRWILDVSVSLYLAVSAIVLGTGAFILLRGLVDVFAMAPVLVIMANMLVALPFAYRIMEGRMAVLADQHDRLCAGLNIRGWRRFTRITLPAMIPEIGFASGLSAALSLGDLTVIALFGSQQFQTLPWLLYQTMARYRREDADALALILLLLTLALFLCFIGVARLIRRRQIYVAD